MPDAMTRQCGGCTACCRDLPMSRDFRTREEIAEAIVAMIERGFAHPAEFKGMLAEFDKPAGRRCVHQCFKGCRVYERRPFSCRIWNCRWLVNADCADLRRPDRSHVIIDIMPDFVQLDQGDGSPLLNIEIVQMWCDKRYPDAWREPSIRAYIERRAAEGIATMIRFDAQDALTVLAPPFWDDGQWREFRGTALDEHRGKELFEGLANARKVKFGVTDNGGSRVSGTADQGTDQAGQVDRGGLDRAAAGGGS
jgi:hypothetical protein